MLKESNSSANLVAPSATRAEVVEQKYWLLLVLALTVLIMLSVGLNGEFPTNDDRLYVNAVRSIVESGVFRISTTNAFDFIPIQLGALVCKLTGFSYEALRFVSSGFHLLGIAGIYFALRELRCRPVDAAIVSSVYAWNPFLIHLSISFMTDVPALALTNWSFFALIAGMRREKLHFFILSVCLLTAAMSTRQTALFFLPVIFCSGLLRLKGLKNLAIFSSCMLIPYLAYCCLQNWILSAMDSSLCYSGYKELLINSARSILGNPRTLWETLAKGSCYLGLFILPVSSTVCLASWNKSRRAFLLALVPASFLMLKPLLSLQRHDLLMPYSPNIFLPPSLGFYCILGGLPIWSFEHLKQFSYFCDLCAVLFCMSLLLSLLANKHRLGSEGQNDSLSAKQTRVFQLLTYFCCFAGLTIQLAVSNFDRYYTLILAPLLICLGPHFSDLAGKRVRIIASILAVATGVYAYIAAADSMTFQRTQHEACSKLVQSGVDPRKIDGGAMHCLDLGGKFFSDTFVQGGGWPESLRGGADRARRRWWPILGEDYIISTCDLQGYHRIDSLKYWSPLAFKDRFIYTLKSDSLR